MSLAIKLDEAYAYQGWGAGWGWANEDERVLAIRVRYRAEGPFRLREKLTAKHRDILGVLRSAREPLSGRDLYDIFDGLPRTWIGYDAGSMSMALVRLEKRGLVERSKSSKWPFTSMWSLSSRTISGERLGVVNRLPGVGPATGAHYVNRKAEARRPRRVLRPAPVLQLVEQPRTEEEQAELDALVVEQKRQQAKDEYWNAERPKGSQSIYPHAKMQSLDAPLERWRGASSAPDKLDTGHDILLASRRDEPHGALEEADRQQRMAAILGELDIEDVDRLDDATLDHLRARLREEGLVSISVMGKERERLRQPERHRGGAPPPTRTHMSTKSKHRKPGHQASAGGSRGSRKSRKRWARETGEW